MRNYLSHEGILKERIRQIHTNNQSLSNKTLDKILKERL